MANVRVKAEVLKEAQKWENDLVNPSWEFALLKNNGFDDHDNPLYELTLKRKKDGHYFMFTYSQTSEWSSLDEWATFVGEEVKPDVFVPGFYVSLSEYEEMINIDLTTIAMYAYDGEQWFFNSDHESKSELPTDLVPLGIVGDKFKA